MLVSMHQPDYLPWLGYFNKIATSDTFIFFDTAFFSGGGFHHRNKIKTSNGSAYLVIPIDHSEYFKRLKDVQLPNDLRWAKKHWRSLAVHYGRAPYFKDYAGFFENLYSKAADYKTLSEINIAIIEYLCKALQLKAKLRRASEFDLNLDLRSTDSILDVIKNVGAKEFLAGPSGKNYLVEQKFKATNINLGFQEFKEREHPQLFPPFISGLSIIDLLFNLGPQASLYLK